jgi:hypothetical protein
LLPEVSSIAVVKLGAPGYGAAGISSGLAALAGDGGGMLAGVAATAVAPVVAAIALALLGFLGMRWLFEMDHEPQSSL